MGEVKTRPEAFEGEMIVAESCATCRFMSPLNFDALNQVMVPESPPSRYPPHHDGLRVPVRRPISTSFLKAPSP